MSILAEVLAFAVDGALVIILLASRNHNAGGALIARRSAMGTVDDRISLWRNHSRSTAVTLGLPFWLYSQEHSPPSECSVQISKSVDSCKIRRTTVFTAEFRDPSLQYSIARTEARRTGDYVHLILDSLPHLCGSIASTSFAI